jgi:hypothetical protein
MTPLAVTISILAVISFILLMAWFTRAAYDDGVRDWCHSTEKRMKMKTKMTR